MQCMVHAVSYCEVIFTLSTGIQGWEDNTVLIIACQNGHSAIAKDLLNHGAAIDYQNKVMNINNISVASKII